MKKVLMILLAAFFAASCCKTQQQETWEFDYPKEYLCDGVWATTKYILPSGSAVLCSSPEHAYGEYRFTLKFNVDGTCRLTGYFGDGVGTYTARGKTVEVTAEDKAPLNMVFSATIGNVAEVTVVQSPGGRVGSWIISK